MVLDGLGQLLAPDMEPDPTKPDAIVTAVTETGFTYRYDTPVQHGRPFWGTQTEGEVYEEGFHMWRKVDDPPLKQPLHGFYSA